MQRRDFLKVCTAAGVFIPGRAFSRLAFSEEGPTTPLIVVVFLRGGCDGLNLVAPTNDMSYINARPPELRVLDDGERAGLQLTNSLSSDIDFRFHPNAQPLHDLYKGEQLSIVHACGLMNATRSHFEAQELIERGLISTYRPPTPGSGWITRYLETKGFEGKNTVPAMAASPGIPQFLEGLQNALAIPSLKDGLAVPGGPLTRTALAQLYAAGESKVHLAGSRTLNLIGLVNSRLPHQADGKLIPYLPKNGAYDDNSFALGLQAIAQIARAEIGLRIACIDHTGWDTHEGQPSRFSGLVTQLAHGLASFHTDMLSANRPFRVIALTEFGRRLRANQSQGTDHGHGSVMMAMGSDIKGGRILGRWPGLKTTELDRGIDLAATTDYRQVFSETLELEKDELEKVFPGLKAAPPLNLLTSL